MSSLHYVVVRKVGCSSSYVPVEYTAVLREGESVWFGRFELSTVRESHAGPSCPVFIVDASPVADFTKLGTVLDATKRSVKGEHRNINMPAYEAVDPLKVAPLAA